jgi:hypothetical protein
MGYAISISQGGRVSLPVSPSSLIYSQFKHVSGVPAPEGVRGVNINRLKIIDTLVEQLARLKQEPEELLAGKEMDWESRLNAMINQFQNQVRTAQAATANSPYAPADPLIGAVFNIRV